MDTLRLKNVKMKRKVFSKVFLFGLLAILFLPNCNNHLVYRNAKGGYVDVDNQLIDSSAYKALNFYREQLKGTLEQIVVMSSGFYEKRKPESELGNLMADAMLAQAQHYATVPVHAAILNYGGIRSVIKPNRVTVGDIFELMPFENVLVIMSLKGETVQKLCNRWAADGGTPIAGMRFKIANKQANNIEIAGSPLDTNATYTIAMTDYMASGGDKCEFLEEEGIFNISLGITYRDALINEFRTMYLNNKLLNPKLDGRIVVE